MNALRHPCVISVSRALNAAFFALTAVYSLLNYSPFTYEQFVKPHVSVALSSFAVWHAAIHWLVLSITALTLAPFLDEKRVGAIGWSYLAASVALGGWLSVHPLWRQPGVSGINLVFAILASVPPIWLATFDHAATVRRGTMPGASDSEPPIDQHRVWTACWMTAAFVCLVYAVAAPVKLRMTGGIALPLDGVAIGWTTSLVSHLTLFTLLFLVLMIVGRVYWLLWAAASAAAMMIVLRVLLAPIGIRGPAAWGVSLTLALALGSAWSGVARHRAAAGTRHPNASALDVWLSPLAPLSGTSMSGAAIALLASAAAVHLLIDRVATFDWEFMLQKLATVAFWLAAFGWLHAAVRRTTSTSSVRFAPAAVIALFAVQQVLLPRASQIAASDRLNPEFALDAYAAVDPSFRIARDTLGANTGADAADFYAYLRAHSSITRDINPVDIRFTEGWSPGGDRPPNVFLFIVDSLRRDYVSAYNEAVSFTPSIGRFAEDSFVFRRAFSRYAGTGLAVPSIWAGAMLLHKQYVLPFAPMNALEKLVAAGGYERFVTEDHLTADLFSATPGTNLLDRNVPEMLHTFCRTMGELEQHLQRVAAEADRRPLFVLTRPLDLHIGNIASAKVPPGESYPGFHEPYAARVHRIDGCFGEFVAALKRLHLYDDSIIVLTSDHGDSLGENQRWGHGFTAFPEVLRIPLIIHLPPALRTRLSTDLARVSFSTDLTPTLYALLGARVDNRTPRDTRDLLVGSPLFVEPTADLSWRRGESYLVASSYGPVYGVIDRNGRHLYLADSVESREYAYDLRPDGRDVRVGMTDADRDLYRRRIREQIGELAAWYRFTPER
jgi:hypothetical protein